MENRHEYENHGDDKTPWITVIVLAVISCASLATGIFYWWNTYARPVEYVQPAVLVSSTGESHSPVEYEPYEPEPDPEPEPYDPPPPPRPVMDPCPEFVALREEYNNPDIMARLLIADSDILVVQGGDHPGWAFLDSEVDLVMGEDFNMVIFLQEPEVLQAYMDFYFFLEHPTMLLETVYGDFYWEIFSFYVAPADFPFAIVNYPCEDGWAVIVEQFTLVSMYNTMLDVTPYDFILTVAVPTAISPDLFYVLQARLYRQITS